MKTKLNRILFQILTMLYTFLFVGSVVFAAPSDDFVITVKTDNPGVSSNTQFEIPTFGDGYNYNVDCNNDGTNEATGVTDNYTCNYPTPGKYTIRIKDNTGTGNGFPRIFFYDTRVNTDNHKLLSINQWGTGHWTSMEAAFMGCSNLNSAPAVNNGGGAVPDWATDVPDLSNVTNMTFMFRNAISFNQDIGDWDVSNVISMHNTFNNAASFNQDISGWDVSNVTDMIGMFSRAASFNQDISGWDVSNVTSMQGMFSRAASFNQDISGWDVSNVRYMSWMFWNATSFNQDLSNWDVSNVKYMENIFTNSGMSTDNYDDTLIGWKARNLQNNVRLDSSAHYCRSENQRQYIIDTYHWTINDAGKSCVTKMNVPSGQHTYTYLYVVVPGLNITPESAKPFASGNISGGTLSLRVGFRAFANPVDIYLAISYSGQPDDIFLIDSSNGLQKNTIVPWKTNQTAAIDESLYGDIKTSNLPVGTYTLYALVVPAGATNMNNSYLWITSFTISH